VLTYCYLCQLAPFVKKDHFHLRATDDLFVMPIEVTDKTNVEEVKTFLHNAGAVEVFEKNAETGWWLGNYAKDRKLFEEETTVTA